MRIEERVARGELPEFEIRVAKEDKTQQSREDFFNKRELRLRAWTDHMIEKFLKPERVLKTLRYEKKGWKGKPYERTANCSREYEYSHEKVFAVEATPEWQKAKAKADKRAANPKGRNVRYYASLPVHRGRRITGASRKPLIRPAK